MLWIDIVCFAIIVLFVLIGIWRGFFKSLFRFLAWGFALIGAYFAQDLLGDLITNNLEISGFTVKIVCLCIGFLIPFLSFSFIGHYLNNAVKKSAISGLNRALGGVFGAIKALIICFVFLTIMHLLPVSGSLKQTRNDSISYSAYKWSLEQFGFSSEEIDILEKATEIVESEKNSAKKMIEEQTTKAIENVKDSLKQSVKESIDKAIDSTKINETITNPLEHNKAE